MSAPVVTPEISRLPFPSASRGGWRRGTLATATPELDGRSWADFNAEQSSYEYLGASQRDDGQNVDRVLARCRIQGHVCQFDGSVQANNPQP